jgi:hypothetical protein
MDEFKTPFGILEEVYVRVAAQGKYNPVVQEFLNLILEGLVTYNELKILHHIHKHTIAFRNTHKSFRRKDIYQVLKIDKKEFYRSKDSLIKKGYLLEIGDKEDYYFYGLNPFKFNGLIVLKSKKSASEIINRETKRKLGLIHTGGKIPSKDGNLPQKVWENPKTLVGKYHPEDVLSLDNHSDFENLKYISIKYILLNQLSAVQAGKTLNIISEAGNPAYLLLEIIKLLQKQPSNSKGILSELDRAHREGTDCNGHPLKTNAPAYLIKCWDTMAKRHWQSLVHNVDMSEETTNRRLEWFQLIMTYPLSASNVIPLSVAKSS